jgi:hypothetical protein
MDEEKSELQKEEDFKKNGGVPEAKDEQRQPRPDSPQPQSVKKTRPNYLFVPKGGWDWH